MDFLIASLILLAGPQLFSKEEAENLTHASSNTEREATNGTASGTASAATSEYSKIEFLISQVEMLDAEFIRNGKSYSGKDAADHLRTKLASAKSSLFAPKKSVWTAQLFIEKIASKSSLSGKEYQIKFKNGDTKNASAWFTEKLKEFKSPVHSPTSK